MNNTTSLFATACLGISLLTASTAILADAENGIIRLQSRHSVGETIDRLQDALKKKGMTIFKRVDHAAGARKVGLELRPTQLLIFGNPKAGTPLMLCSQTAALDLPQKALAYEDKNGQVWLAYNDPAYMAKRHETQGCEKNIAGITQALRKFTMAATN